MTKRKFYKTVFQIELLSEEPISPDSLEEISRLAEGDCSAKWGEKSHKTLNGKQAAKELQKQGSDPEFFMIDENGNELEEDNL